MTSTNAPEEALGCLEAESWEIAGQLLVDPSEPPPVMGEWLPLSRVLNDLVCLQRYSRDHPHAAFPLESLLQLGTSLLRTPLGEDDRERVRQAADGWRRELVGETVSYVINRNLNASNLCALRCGFCAFRRSPGEEGSFRLSRSQLRERAAEAKARGATELCLQAGLDPDVSPQKRHLDSAVTLLGDLREAAPGLHIHGFSPQELLYIAQQDQLPLQTVLRALREAGLESVPGTAAEVLSPRVRRLICPEKLSARAWVAVIWEVHRSGLPSTSTLLAGHLETPWEQLCHLCTLGALQHEAWRKERPGFTEFIVLPFVGAAAPAPLRARVARDQPDPRAMLLLTAQSRLLLGAWFLHHQPSWVKLTLPVAAEALRWGCDDLGGTLMEEHISTMAGAAGGTQQTPRALQDAAQRLGRPVRQRSTLYGAVDALCGCP